VAPPALVPPQAAPAPPPPLAADKRDADVRLHAEVVEAARNSPALVGRDAAALQKFETVPSKEAVVANVKGQTALGLRYTVFRSGAEVPPNTPFLRGESARLRIEADRSGYLYVLAGKRALFAGSVLANQPVMIDTKARALHLLLLPQPDSGPLSTLISRARQQSAGVVTDVSISSR
jgi:hypothetical protein